MGGCVSSKQTKKDTPDVPNPSKVPTLEEALEEALEKLGRNEEKVSKCLRPIASSSFTKMPASNKLMNADL